MDVERGRGHRGARWLLLALLWHVGGCGGEAGGGAASPDVPALPGPGEAVAFPQRSAGSPAPGEPLAQGGAEASAAATAVTDDRDLGPTTDAEDPWCGALSVFREACQGCHGEELVGGAPFPLLTHDHTQAPAVSDPTKTVQELIGSRIHDTVRPMPPLSQPPLTQTQLGALDAWLAAGAPNSPTACEQVPEASTQAADAELEWPEDCQERYEILAHDNGEPFVVPADTELTTDITIPVPWAGGGPVQALAIRPVTGNKRVVHHWILYAGATDFITSWSPGKPMETFPQGVGVHMPSDGTFRLNMHYYNVGNDQPEPDQSGLEVCITREPRPYTATTYMFSGSATVPAGQAVDNVSTCDVVATEPVHLITSSPHMHQYGVAAKLEIVRPDGSVEVLEDAPFNWEDQHVTPIDGVIDNGDQVRITCSYVNTSERTVRFGSSSQDEMCFNFARYYPMGAFDCIGGSFF